MRKNGKQWMMKIDKWYHHPTLGWQEKLNIEVYYGKPLKYLVHAECKPLDVNYLKNSGLKFRSSCRVIEEPLEVLVSREEPFLSI